MKLIEADKVEQAIKDYWKAHVDRLPIPKSIEEHDERVNRLDAILEHNDGLLKAIDELPSVEPEAISEWKKEFREYVGSLDITRDDWKGIIEYIDELPSAEPDTTTHDSIPAKTGKNDGVGTSGDCISRQMATNVIKKRLFETALNNVGIKQNIDETLVDVAENRLKNWFDDVPSIQPKQNEMIKEIRRWINSGNRGNADYFIVDRIEEIINAYEIN